MWNKFIVLLIFSVFPLYSLANENILSTQNPFDSIKINSLQSGVRTSYPPSVVTVGQAVMYVLAATDYKLIVGLPASAAALEIISRPIPPEAIQDKTIPIYKALLLLIGKDERLVIDRKKKLITFEKISGRG